MQALEYIRTFDTVAVGGDGSNQSFRIQRPPQGTPTVPLKSLSVQVKDNYLTHLKATFVDGGTSEVGRGGGNPAAFTFQADEAIDKLYLTYIGWDTGRVAISFTTNLGRTFQAGGTGQTGQQVAISGGRIFGFYGDAGAAIDKLGIIMEIPITQTELYDVVYDKPTAERHEIGPIALDTVTLTNNSDDSQNASINRSFSVSTGSSWTIKAGAKIGAKVSVSTGIPLFVDGKVEVSAELSFEYTYGRTYSSTQTFQYTASALVKPKEQITAEVSGKQGTLKVSYTAMLQLTYADGTVDQVAVDGHYEGVTCYEVVVLYKSPKSEKQILAELKDQVAIVSAA